MTVHTLSAEADPLGLAPERDARLGEAGIEARDTRVHHLDTGRVPLRGNQEIGRFAWARQSIELHHVGGAPGAISLFLYEADGNDTPLQVTVNGVASTLEPDARRQGAHHWRSLSLPEGLLVDGVNELVLSSDNLALNSWALGVAVGPESRGSSWSWDRGASWVSEGLGLDQSLMGDFAIRWVVHAPGATFGIRSPVLAATDQPTRIESVSSATAILRTEVRVAVSSDFGLTWGSWEPFTLGGQRDVDALQLRFVLGGGARLDAVRVTTTQPVELRPAAGSDVTLEPFHSEQLVAIREEYGLDAVVAGCSTDVERAAALCSWLHERWIHQAGKTIYSPWHAPTILAWQRAGVAEGVSAPIGFCVHFAVVLTQLAAAVGVRARAVIIGQVGEDGGGGHFVAEIWSRELSRWVCFDPDFDYHWQIDGEPAGVADVHRLWQADELDRLGLGTGRAFTRHPHGGLWPQEHVRDGGYAWFGLPLHQNWLEDPRTRLLHHGAVNYHEVEVLWFNGHQDMRLRYPVITDRVEDFSAELIG